MCSARSSRCCPTCSRSCRLDGDGAALSADSIRRGDDRVRQRQADLRQSIRAIDVTEIFRESGFAVFAKAVATATSCAQFGTRLADKSRRFLRQNRPPRCREGAWPRGCGLPRMAEKAKGPIAKFLSDDKRAELGGSDPRQPRRRDFLRLRGPRQVGRPVDGLRTHLGRELEIIESKHYKFAGSHDFPFYERDPRPGRSPSAKSVLDAARGTGGHQTRATRCPSRHTVRHRLNGVELSSGAIGTRPESCCAPSR